ncbi:phosphotransferase enzyme family protein [Pseudarthrobacter sp. DSP2-3-2b1]|uniref:phosphotransferase enzyme family protein n=1 Tax=Pseudarthrobacter sp. DSP2-3-2b1 TaxID=2804661 RepID=UPI003CEC9988
MLPISEIRRISRTVDESWRSPEADAVASGWSYPAGAALAGLHASGDAPAGVPNGQETAPDGFRDRRLARAMREVAEEVAGLDSGQHSRGIWHGDFELDNIRFGPRGVTFFDTDEAHKGWFAGDVALAVRDLTGTTLGSREHPGLLAAFLAGYRSRRPFTAAEEASLPLHSLAASARLIRQLDSVVDVEDDGQAQWVRELAASLREHQEWHRERLRQHRT